MSITNALIAAGSGLSVSARGAEIVAGNVANAGTEGYARRELRLGTVSLGAGGAQVRILGVERQADVALAGDRRLATSAAGEGTTRAQMYARIETALGTPGDVGALTSRIAAFDSALIAAAGMPESLPRLSDVVVTAGDLARALSDAAGAVQETRLRADQEIAADVAMLNSGLEQIHRMNLQIRAVTGQNRDPSSLIDQRTALIDNLAAIVPLREIARDQNEVALYSANGLVLLDAHPAVFGFDPVPAMGAALSREGGTLSGLTVDGREIAVDGDYAMIAGGTLAAGFAVRDDLAPAEADHLDLLAGDLMARLADTSVDPTYDASLGGLFIDTGAVAPPQVDPGLAGRIRVNEAVDPAQGGALWRIRAGIGAADAGDPGNSSILTAMTAALAAAVVPDGAGSEVPARSLVGHAGDIVSGVASRRISEDGRAAFAVARETSLRQIEAEKGVDTDQEIQILMRIEKQYAANAKVLAALDQMLARLMEI